MNTIIWKGDETITNLYDHWIALVEEGNRAGLLADLSSSVNRGERTYELTDDGLERTKPPHDTDEMMILELAYGSDADKIIEIVRESDEYEVGENLK